MVESRQPGTRDSPGFFKRVFAEALLLLGSVSATVNKALSDSTSQEYPTIQEKQTDRITHRYSSHKSLGGRQETRGLDAEVKTGPP